MKKFSRFITIGPIRSLVVSIAVLASCPYSRDAHTSFIVDIDQVGPNVVVTGSGTLDLNGLTFEGTGGIGTSLVVPREPLLFIGPTSDTSSEGEDGYGGITGSAALGPSIQATDANSGTGDFVGLTDAVFLDVVHGYISGSTLNDSMTFDSASIASLGLVAGTYTYT